MRKLEYWICAGLLTATAVLLFGGSSAGRQWLSAFAPQDDQPVLVLDAGHGGFDGGAVGAHGTTEQDINLHITYSVQALAGLFGYPVVLTRPDTEALDYQEGRTVRENKVADIRARERIVTQTAQPVFISIHLNKFEDPQYFGAQVFYSKNNADSQVLAEHLQAALLQGIQNRNIRRAKPAAPAIYLMKQLNCPAVIVECGFLSNPEEEAALCSPDYQKRLAVCILQGYQQYRNGATYETKDPISLQ